MVKLKKQKICTEKSGESVHVSELPVTYFIGVLFDLRGKVDVGNCWNFENTGQL